MYTDQPRIELLKEKKLIGIHLQTSIAIDQTAKLWQNFMPKRKEITNTLNTDLYSIQIFPDNFDFTFSNLNFPFTKWAAVEVDDHSHYPSEMSELIIPSGLYAVFHYKGSSTDSSIFKYIFGEWLPNSEYAIDNRPHFEILGAKYKNNHPDSEEDIYIPIQLKSLTLNK